jgi:ABC-type branched-subunit amino acid transport system permease subunit
MAITSTWLEHTGENAVGYACAAALATLPNVVNGMQPWWALFSGAGIGAITALLSSGAALRVPNGTASFLPNVVAAK